MGYTLDPLAEHLVHALCEAVVLRRQLRATGQESVVLDDLIQDLSRAAGLYGGLADTGGEDGPLATFVRYLSYCDDTRKVVRAFKSCPPMDRFLLPPYFSRVDLASEEP